LTSVTHGVISTPKTENESPENGITAKAISAGIKSMIGATKNTRRSTRDGMMSSLSRSFRMSAIGWSSPWGPTRRGPRRTCM
jgi:hypothetical protein